MFWDWFSTYETMSTSSPFIGNNASRKIVGMGTVRSKIFDRGIRKFGYVRHGLNLKRNFMYFEYS